MSEWIFSVKLADWPKNIPDGEYERRNDGTKTSYPRTLQEVIFAMLNVLNEDNVEWYEASLALDKDAEGNY
jgi:hypothetical protein